MKKHLLYLKFINLILKNNRDSNINARINSKYFNNTKLGI